MFERFTDRARRVVVLAQDEARGHGNNFIGVEHLVAGLVGENEGVAAKVLLDRGVTVESIRTVYLAPGQPPAGHMPFTVEAKKMIEHSLREALQLGHNYIGTEHLLLAVTRQLDPEANEDCGLLPILGDRYALREAVMAYLRGYEPPPLSLETRLRRALRPFVAPRLLDGAVRVAQSECDA